MGMVKKLKWPLLLVILALIGYLLLKQYQTDLNNNLNKEISQAEALGLAFGSEHDQLACLNQSLVNIKGCSAFSCGVVHGRFFKACLSQAQKNAALCEAVPAYTEKKDRATKDWLRDVCFDYPETNICNQLMRQRQQLCATNN